LWCKNESFVLKHNKILTYVYLKNKVLLLVIYSENPAAVMHKVGRYTRYAIENLQNYIKNYHNCIYQFCYNACVLEEPQKTKESGLFYALRFLF
jgi:hypothetical protein